MLALPSPPLSLPQEEEAGFGGEVERGEAVSWEIVLSVPEV